MGRGKRERGGEEEVEITFTKRKLEVAASLVVR